MTFFGFCSVFYAGASWWWLRSANNNNNFNNVNTNGNNNNNNANNSGALALGSSLARQSNLTAKSVRDGEKENKTLLGNEVNKYSDRPGRTLLAWQGLMVNPLFHAQRSYAADATIQ